jgi:hypothetical protein
MAKKRDLKRSINYICSDLFAEAMAAAIYGNLENKESADNLLSTIIITRNEFVSRISHPEPGMKASKYYRALIDDFNQSTLDIVDKIGNLG